MSSVTTAYDLDRPSASRLSGTTPTDMLLVTSTVRLSPRRASVFVEPLDHSSGTQPPPGAVRMSSLHTQAPPGLRPGGDGWPITRRPPSSSTSRPKCRRSGCATTRLREAQRQPPARSGGRPLVRGRRDGLPGRLRAGSGGEERLPPRRRVHGGRRRRSTPTCVGTTRSGPAQWATGTVHPHVCGTTWPATPRRPTRTVHPHVRGDDDATGDLRALQDGPPPRASGRRTGAR